MAGMTDDLDRARDADAVARQTDAALHDARAALRRVDTLAASVQGLDDPEVMDRVAEARGAVESVVRLLTRRHQDERQRARSALRPRH